jgi:uncharacterized DUF497 family protein
VTFTWDARKAKANERKHGISFEEAAHRFIAIGFSANQERAYAKIR